MGTRNRNNLGFKDIPMDLIEAVRSAICKSESEFEKKQKPRDDESFLWEHTRFVMAIVSKLTTAAAVDNKTKTACIIAALFHDAGKFRGGTYHQNEKPEELDAVELAEIHLNKRPVADDVKNMVKEGLSGLYNENNPQTPVSDFVHDADFLSKFGTLGTAVFFSKSALRGRTILSSIERSLSKELTYGSVLKLNMRTEAAKEIASKKQTDALSYYTRLLDDLSEWGICEYRVQKHSAKLDQFAKPLEIFTVYPVRCTKCSSEKYQFKFMTESGIKCTKLIQNIECKHCYNLSKLEYCLPEMGMKSQEND